jgi:hypothetical protein
MKKLKNIVIALVVMLTCVAPASAQFSIGPKIGLTTTKLHFNRDGLKSENRTGFTGGLMAEFMLPVFNLGLDASVMYVHRSVGAVNDETINREYIEVPINLKWKIGIPAVGNIVTPFLFTGPSFAFLCSKKDFKNFLENKTCDVNWNFGVGVQLFKKVQVAGSYGIGINSSVKSKFGTTDTGESLISGKDRFWTVTAAYLF